MKGVYKKSNDIVKIYFDPDYGMVFKARNGKRYKLKTYSNASGAIEEIGWIEI